MDMKQLSEHLQHIRNRFGAPDETDTALIAAIEKGLPLCSRPYQRIAEQLGIGEQEVVDRLASLHSRGVIKRLGVVVRHHELGYRANAMVVWDVPDDRVAALGHCFSQYDFITLCYRRPRQLPQWPYNLFCMIHGKSHDEVREQVAQLIDECRLQAIAHQILFSHRRFKQRGARYHTAASPPQRASRPLEAACGT
jgi:siroheme decarboxylase